MRYIFISLIIFMMLPLNGFEWRVADRPHDNGQYVLLTFSSEEDDSINKVQFIKNDLDQSEIISEFKSPQWEYIDYTGGNKACYVARIHYQNSRIVDLERKCMQPKVNLLKHSILNLFVALLLITSIIVGSISYFQYRTFYIRKIPALDAMKNAMALAAEKGKAVLFIPGSAEVSNPQTLASLGIFAALVESVNKYHSDMLLFASKPMTFLTSEMYCEESTHDNFTTRREDSRFLAEDVMAYSSGVNGYIGRKKPVTIIFAGSFGAESLLLSEPRAKDDNCIQLGGTADIGQIPFFHATLKHNIMAEELFVAKAYLTKDRKMLAGVKGLDLVRMILIFVITGISLLLTVLEMFNMHNYTEILKNMLKVQ